MILALILSLLWQPPCSTNSTKTYMDYTMTDIVSSEQYQYMKNNTTIKDGLLYEDEYIGVALGSWWGGIGTKWIIELDTGIVLKVVKVEEKADEHVYNGCQHKRDGSVIEFVIDTASVPNEWWGSNGLVFNGNFNNSDLFNGKIVRIAQPIEVEDEPLDLSRWFPKIELHNERPLYAVFFIVYP